MSSLSTNLCSLMAPIQLAVVGAGGMAAFAHLPAIQAFQTASPGSVALVAVVDPDPDKREHFRRTYGFERSFASVTEMLVDVRPDAALTLTPYWLNAQVSAELLEAGVSVLMEKPPGMTREETMRLITLTECTGCFAQVGYNRRHWPALQLALAWLQEDSEPLQFLRGTKHRTGRIHEDYPFYTSSHVIDTLLAVGGEPVECFTCRTPIPGAPEAWNFVSTIRFAGGWVAQSTALPHVSYNQEIYEFHTLASTIIVNQHWGTGTDAEVCQYRGETLARHVVMAKGTDHLRVNGFLGQLETFLAAVAGQGSAYPTVAQCLRTVELSESIRDGRLWRVEARA